MKGKQYRITKLMYQLENAKRRGEKIKIWHLDNEAKREIQKRYRIEPYVCKIHVYSFKATSVSNDTNGLLKHLYHLKRRGIRFEEKVLNKSQRKLLDSRHIQYDIINYKIYLS